MKKDFNVLEGEVVESLPNTTFRVKVMEGPSSATASAKASEVKKALATSDVASEGKERTILCHLSGKMRINRIKVIPGDKVRVAVTPYDETRGRIIYRLK